MITEEDIICKLVSAGKRVSFPVFLECREVGINYYQQAGVRQIRLSVGHVALNEEICASGFSLFLHLPLVDGDHSLLV